MNAMCTFIYLFVVYFSFAPVISASIHVNYFDIQVLRMVTETETLTSILHHNIFTYLDYVFYAITITIQARRTRHAGHCWRSKDEIVSDVLLWTPAYGQSKAGRPARTFIQQLCDDTECNPEDLPKAMNDRETWRERVRDIRASHTS